MAINYYKVNVLLIEKNSVIYSGESYKSVKARSISLKKTRNNQLKFNAKKRVLPKTHQHA
jgi:hypothetical protein